MVFVDRPPAFFDADTVLPTTLERRRRGIVTWSPRATVSLVTS